MKPAGAAIFSFVLAASVLAAPIWAFAQASGSAPTEPQIVFEGGGLRQVVTVADLEDVAPVFLDPGHGIAFLLDDRAAAEFADLTEQLIGQELVVEVCGLELARPVVRERIGGGRGLLTAADRSQAFALSAALSGNAACPRTDQ